MPHDPTFELSQREQAQEPPETWGDYIPFDGSPSAPATCAFCDVAVCEHCGTWPPDEERYGHIIRAWLDGDGDIVTATLAADAGTDAEVLAEVFGREAL